MGNATAGTAFQYYCLLGHCLSLKGPCSCCPNVVINNRHEAATPHNNSLCLNDWVCIKESTRQLTTQICLQRVMKDGQKKAATRAAAPSVWQEASQGRGEVQPVRGKSKSRHRLLVKILSVLGCAAPNASTLS